MKKYKFGDCLPESLKLYNKLKRQGLKPKLVEGWVEIEKNCEDIMPNEKFLKIYFPDDFNELQKNYYYNEYPRVLEHTWLMLDDEIIDVTKSQFKKYGGIIRYFENCRYWFKGNKTILVDDIGYDFNEVVKYGNHIKYPNEV